MFNRKTKKYIKNYISKDLPKNDFYDGKFTYLSNKFRSKIIKDYQSARKLYKILEGISDKRDLLRLECKIQIILYASIQEAVLSWVLFRYFKSTTEVKNLFESKVLKRYSIPITKLNTISSSLKHDGKDIIPCFETIQKRGKEKIRFDSKVKAALSLGIISNKMCEDLIAIYEYRNTVHVEAEIKKQIKYDLEMSELAYRKVEGLDIELTKYFNEHKNRL